MVGRILEEVGLDPKYLELEITESVAMARSLNLGAVAEGVETEEQLEFLRSLACDEIQGFLFSKPLPSEELIKLFAKDDRMCA